MMAKPLLLRYLGSTFALRYVFAATVIIWLSVLIAPSTAMAGTLVAVTPVPTSCPRTSPTPGSGPLQHAIGTIARINGQILQITPKIPGLPINATYSSTTHITQDILITAPPALVLLKGVNVSVQATQNPNGTLTATLIILSPHNQSPDIHNCFGGGAMRPTPTLPAPTKSPSALPDNGSCPVDRGPIQKPTLPPNAPMNQQTTCKEILGTVDLLQGIALTITDRRGITYTVLLTTGPKATTIINSAPTTLFALKVGTSVVVVGPTVQGVIAASEIAILPATPTATPTTVPA